MTLSEQEHGLIGTLRVWGDEGGNFTLTVELREGAWELALSRPGQADSGPAARGVGQTFDEAWDNMNS